MSSSFSTAQVVAIAVIVVVVAVATILIVRHVRYVNAIKARGWTFDGSPGIESALNHSAPPFGMGIDRNTDDRISGTTGNGVEFDVFEYSYANGGGSFDGRVASLRLPMALPAVFVTSRFVRNGVHGGWSEPVPGLKAGGHPEVAGRLLSSAALQAIQAYAEQHAVAGGVVGDHGVDLSIDGDRLVAVGAPKQPDRLAPWLESLGQIVTAVDWPALSPDGIDFVPPGYHFYDRPDWVYLGSQDSLVDLYSLDRGGHSHEARDVIRGQNDGLPMDAFVHHWVTTHTRTVSDGKGGSRTETYTQSHSEPILIFTLPFVFPYLNLNGGWAWGRGERVRFESEDFNSAYKIRTEDARFASDVIHPRMMEMIMAWGPLPFVIDGRQLRYEPGGHDTEVIGHAVDFTHTFFNLVQSFVWKNLAIQPPPFRGDRTS